MTLPILNGYEGRIAAARGLREGIDFISYEMVPMGPGDRVNDNGRWIDRRTTDGNILAADGRNARGR